MRKPSKKEWIGAISSIVVIVSGVFGVNLYNSQPALGVAQHDHPSHTHRSTESIKRLIDEAIEDYDTAHVEKSGRH
jgi:hypothetical protein